MSEGRTLFFLFSPDGEVSKVLATGSRRKILNLSNELHEYSYFYTMAVLIILAVVDNMA